MRRRRRRTISEIEAERRPLYARLAELREEAAAAATPPGWVAFLLARIPWMRAGQEGAVELLPSGGGHATIRGWASASFWSMILPDSREQRIEALRALLDLELARSQGEIDDEVKL